MSDAQSPANAAANLPVEADAERHRLRIELLGGFRVSAGGMELSAGAWRSRKAMQIIKRLALTSDHAMLREQLIDLLWPDADVLAASNRLRQTLHVGRRQLRVLPLDAAQILRSQGDRVHLYPPEQCWTDVRAFEDAARLARTTDDPAIYWAAIDRYAGPLLPEDLYDDWTMFRRESLESTYLRLLEHVARLHEDRGEFSQSIEALRRLISVEPTYEAAHLRLMRLFAATGSRPLALAQYQQLVDVLAHTFDITPEPETQALYQSIKEGATSLNVAPGDQPAGFRPKPQQSSGNLPHAVSRFIGREQELIDVVQQVANHRLVTLTGPGGTGKTRLALEAAQHVATSYANGAWLVRLAGLVDPALVPQAVVDALGVEAEAHCSLVDTLVMSLRDAELLLLLDNCEHLISACAELAQTLLHACPRLRILATSRETLRLPGECPWAVPSLPVPHSSATLIDATKNDAVRLFVDRVGLYQPGFQLTPENVEAVCTICRRLDGLPLALELAAARASVLSLSQLASRLDDALAVLTSGARRAPTRQQTLRATLDWSYQLLDADERILFRRLAVFTDGWTLDMAESICAGADLPSSAILELHGQLVSKSLVQVALDSDEARYRLLEPVRQYAMELLEACDDRDSLSERHATYFVTFLEEIDPELSGPRQVDWIARLEREHDNVRAALRWAIQRGEADIALRIEAVLWRYWGIRWHSSEGLKWIQDTFALANADRTLARARAALGAGELARRILDFDTSIAMLEESLDIHRELGDASGTAQSLSYLANAAAMAGDFNRARTCATESLELFRALDDGLGIARTLNILAEDARLHGDYVMASRNYREALELDRLLGDQQGIAVRLHNLGYVALHEGDVALAARSFCDGFMLDQELGYRTGPLSFLEGMAAAMSAADRLRLAARLYGAWEANCALPGTEFKLHPPDQQEFDRYTSGVAAALGSDQFAQEWEAGRQLSLEQAVAEAMVAERELAGGAIVRAARSRPEKVGAEAGDEEMNGSRAVHDIARPRPESQPIECDSMIESRVKPPEQADSASTQVVDRDHSAVESVDK
jgi:predicted ATPase/DNA-binding SARP family transcriptional activator